MTWDRKPPGKPPPKPKTRLRAMPYRRPFQGALALTRRQEALRMRVEGIPVPQIAEALGVTTPAAYRAIQAALIDAARELSELAERYRSLEVMRLDMLMAGHWPYAVGADNREPDVQSAAIVVRCIQERSKLMGLYLQEDTPKGIPVADLQAMVERQREAAQNARALGVELQPIDITPPEPPPEPSE